MEDNVYTVEDYYDGPREGFADFEGRPHYYRCVFDAAGDDWKETFRLTPVSEEVLKFALENWQIWLRWKAAFDAGETDTSTHPALPEDRSRYLQLNDLVEKAIANNAGSAFVALGQFEVTQERSFTVTWRILPS